MAYETTRERLPDKVLGVDYDKKTVLEHQNAGRRVIWGDATDYDFWHKIDLHKIRLIMLSMTKHQANLLALQEIKSAGFQGPVSATARFADELQELKKAGATAAYNLFGEAGAGYADHVCRATGLACKTDFVAGSDIPVLRNNA
jgi:Trk K+ transport system NAD-binding subunit